jgi:hypothetical protein
MDKYQKTTNILTQSIICVIIAPKTGQVGLMYSLFRPYKTKLRRDDHL